MFFPVSSTGHLVLVQHWMLSRDPEFPRPESAEMIFFDLVVHLGTLVSIVVVFRQSLFAFLGRTGKELLSVSWPFRFEVWNQLPLRLMILGLFSVFLTGLIGYPLLHLYAGVFANPSAIAATLIITGILLWKTDRVRPQQSLRNAGWFQSCVIGTAQALALLPGLSRSGLTISFALFSGMRRRWAAEYSFFLAIPTILGASALMAYKVATSEVERSVGLLAYLTGFVVAAVVGIFALKMVIKLLYRARFRYFAYYVWFLAIVVFLTNRPGVVGG